MTDQITAVLKAPPEVRVLIETFGVTYEELTIGIDEDTAAGEDDAEQIAKQASARLAYEVAVLQDMVVQWIVEWSSKFPDAPNPKFPTDFSDEERKNLRALVEKYVKANIDFTEAVSETQTNDAIKAILATDPFPVEVGKTVCPRILRCSPRPLLTQLLVGCSHPSHLQGDRRKQETARRQEEEAGE